jgi:hypothetical protein
MSVWRTFGALAASERAVLLRALATVITVRAALWLLPSPTIVRSVSRLAAGPEPRRARDVPLDRLVWAIQAAARRVPGASCLTQAIAGLLLLRRHGYAARFCVGVARGAAGDVRAHAWLERDGKVVIGGGGGVQVFTRLPDLGAVQ